MKMSLNIYQIVILQLWTDTHNGPFQHPLPTPLLNSTLHHLPQFDLPSETAPAPNHTQSRLHQYKERRMIRPPSNTLSSPDIHSPHPVRDSAIYVRPFAPPKQTNKRLLLPSS